MTAAGQRLRRQVEASNALHRQYLDDPDFGDDYARFIDLQRRYFLPLYDDLRDRPGYAEAIDFVVTDLTGTGIARRDHDLERVVGVMSRTLPGKALDTLASAMHLNARILEINIRIARELRPALADARSISERDYCMASRTAMSHEECVELIGLTRTAAESLEQFARLPMIRWLLMSMRVPARMSGFGDLQAFLEKGLATFLGVADVGGFLDDLETRMSAIFRRVLLEDSQNLDTGPIP